MASQNNFEDIDYWKAIILYGLNQATYKIALGKTLLQLSNMGNDKVDWDILSKVYLDNYIERLSGKSMPQQSNPNRRTVMERIVGRLQNGNITHNQAVELVETDAFNDVYQGFRPLVFIKTWLQTSSIILTMEKTLHP